MAVGTVGSSGSMSMGTDGSSGGMSVGTASSSGGMSSNSRIGGCGSGLRRRPRHDVKIGENKISAPPAVAPNLILKVLSTAML